MAANKRLSAWTRRFVDLLEDGQRPFDEVVELAAMYVPPGRAIRKFMQTPRKNIAIAFSTEEQIRSGSRTIVLESVRMLAYRERILIYTDGQTDYVVISDDSYETYFGEPRRSPLNLEGLTFVNRYATINSKRTIASGGAIDDSNSGPDRSDSDYPDRKGTGSRLARHHYNAKSSNAISHGVYGAFRG